MSADPDPLYVPPTRTSAEPGELAASIGEWYVELTDSPDRAAVALATAQALHEGCAWNFNVGGLKREAGEPWTTLGTHEVLPEPVALGYLERKQATEPKFPHAVKPGQRAVYFPNQGPGGPKATHFRAFLSLDDATFVFVHKLLVRFDAGEALRSGDPAALARALKRRGYYTAAEHEYAAALARRLEQVPPFDLPLMSSRRWRELNGLIGLTVHGRGGDS